MKICRLIPDSEARFIDLLQNYKKMSVRQNREMGYCCYVFGWGLGNVCGCESFS